MSDIVAALREWHAVLTRDASDEAKARYGVLLTAADEIEALRGALCAGRCPETVAETPKLPDWCFRPWGKDVSGRPLFYGPGGQPMHLPKRGYNMLWLLSEKDGGPRCWADWIVMAPQEKLRVKNFGRKTLWVMECILHTDGGVFSMPNPLRLGVHFFWCSQYATTDATPRPAPSPAAAAPASVCSTCGSAAAASHPR